jgi:integrase
VVPSNVVQLRAPVKRESSVGATPPADLDASPWRLETETALPISFVSVVTGDRIGLEDAGRAHGYRYDEIGLARGPYLPEPSDVASAIIGNVITGERLTLGRFAETLGRFAETLGEATVAASMSAADRYTTDELLDDYVRARTARGRKKGTLTFYAGICKTLRRLLPKLAKDITHKFLLGYIETRREEGAGERVKKELHSFLKPALKLAKKNKLFADDPRDVVPDMDSLAKPRDRSLSVDDVWSIVLFLEKRSAEGRDHAACFAWSHATGAEHAAWSRAKPDDIRDDLGGCQIHGTKNEWRERFSPTRLTAQQELLAYAKKNAAGTDGHLFRPWSITNANSDLKEACAALEIEPCSTHDARRSYQDWYLDAGVRDSLIDAALGHKPSSVLAKHYRKGKIEPSRLISLFDADMRAHAKSEALDDPQPLAQGAPVQPAGELRSNREGATEQAGRATDGPIAQSVELRTFKPELADIATALANALEAATRAGQWTLAATILDELRARRTGGVS